jgi:hypothetical protein
MAVPRLARFKGVSFLQLRHPLLVIRSFVATRFFSNPKANKAQRSYAAAYFSITGDDVTDTMRWWVYWNELAARHANLCYRVEDLDVPLFANMLDMIGFDGDAQTTADTVIAKVGRDVNSSASRGDTPGQLRWSDLPEGEDKERLEVTARRWGYTL